MLCEMQCNALWAVCSVCWGKGSLTQKMQELETRVQLMVHQQQMNKLLLEDLEKERLIEHLQKELLEIKLERDKLQQLLEKQRVEQLQWSESKVVSKDVSIPTVPVRQPESHPQQASLESHPQHVQFENLHEEDSHSSESDS